MDSSGDEETLRDALERVAEKLTSVLAWSRLGAEGRGSRRSCADQHKVGKRHRMRRWKTRAKEIPTVVRFLLVLPADKMIFICSCLLCTFEDIPPETNSAGWTTGFIPRARGSCRLPACSRATPSGTCAFEKLRPKSPKAASLVARTHPHELSQRRQLPSLGVVQEEPLR